MGNSSRRSRNRGNQRERQQHTNQHGSQPKSKNKKQKTKWYSVNRSITPEEVDEYVLEVFGTKYWTLFEQPQTENDEQHQSIDG